MTEVNEDGERIVEEHQGFRNGQEVFLADESDEFEQYGCGLGDQGTLRIIEVGAEEHGNKHVAMYFIPEGSDEPLFKVDSSLINPA